MAWRRPGGKSLSEPMMASLLTHICVTRPQWVQTLKRPWEYIPAQTPWNVNVTSERSSLPNKFYVTINANKQSFITFRSCIIERISCWQHFLHRTWRQNASAASVFQLAYIYYVVFRLYAPIYLRIWSKLAPIQRRNMLWHEPWRDVKKNICAATECMVSHVGRQSVK